MAQQYASNQPQGFKNHVENVAIVGAGGQVGAFITAALLKEGKHRITAITRHDSTSKAPEGVATTKVDYSDQSSLVSALKGQEVLIITMGVMAPPEQQTKLIDAAAEAGVAYVLPNEYGYPQKPAVGGMLGAMAKKHTEYCNHIEQLGKSSWIGISCGFWYEFSLAGSPYRYGFDLLNKKVTFFDDGTTKINTSTWPQTGLGVAKLLGLKLLPEDENDKSATLSSFKNRFVQISSFRVSQRDMLASVLRVTGTQESEWEISHEPSKERYDSGVAMLQKGQREGFAQQMYTRVFYPDGSGDFESTTGLQNKELGIPVEDIDEYTKKAMDIAKTGKKY